MVKCKKCHGKNEEKGEFGSPRSESSCFKGGTMIMLKPSCWEAMCKMMKAT